MPTPRPIITPRVVAKSGIVTTLLSSPTMIEPALMPARATLTGRPMARTEPKAKIRMTMAKARPSSSEEDAQALHLGHVLLDLLGDVLPVLDAGVGRQVDVGVGDRARRRAPGRDLLRPLRRV